MRVGQGRQFEATRERIRGQQLHTVCEEAQCPNLGRCWAHGRATVMILGDRCSRGCRFCNVESRAPCGVDLDEPRRVAEAVAASGLREVVLTSVTRDDLPDGGAAIWAETISRIREAVPGILIEVLIPDFEGNEADLKTVIDVAPDVLGHNLETVPRLYEAARPQAGYGRSLELLERAARAGMLTKTSLMVGMGETLDEIRQVMRDAHEVGCRIFYAGQYLQPSKDHLPVVRYVTPEEFESLKAFGTEIGFEVVVSGPLVRSSYHEEEQAEFVRRVMAGEA